APFSRGETAIEPSSEIDVAEDVRPAFLMKPNASYRLRNDPQRLRIVFASCCCSAYGLSSN
ncbi:MAG: hypothetical protein EOP02_18915, partial [Proteobacteria bacterium]